MTGEEASSVSETQRSAGVSELRGPCDGPALAVADIAARCPYPDLRIVTNFGQDLTQAAEP
jgi:hypothetical protein